MRTAAMAILAALTAALIVSTTAMAGGSATVTLDGSPPEARAGEPIELSFTVRQHGKTPVSWPQAYITARNTTTGERLTVDAKPQGAPGHYTASVTFPSAGEWDWAIETRELLVQTKLRRVTVAGPASAAAAVADPPQAAPQSGLAAQAGTAASVADTGNVVVAGGSLVLALVAVTAAVLITSRRGSLRRRDIPTTR